MPAWLGHFHSWWRAAGPGATAGEFSGQVCAFAMADPRPNLSADFASSIKPEQDPGFIGEVSNALEKLPSQGDTQSMFENRSCSEDCLPTSVGRVGSQAAEHEVDH